MEKDFDRWNVIKKNLDSVIEKDNLIFFREREIWFCSLGVNIGSEQNGANDLFERPILILRKYTKNIFLGIPLTKSKKTGSWYFKLDDFSSLVLNQSRVLDSRRLTRKIKTIEQNLFEKITESFREII